MVTTCIHKIGVPVQQHDWVQNWCADVNNAAASQKLDWLPPDTIAGGSMCDISKFRFHIWNQYGILYWQNNLNHHGKNGRCLGSAGSVGGHLTYLVKQNGIQQNGKMLSCFQHHPYTSNMGTKYEHTNDNINQADRFFHNI